MKATVAVAMLLLTWPAVADQSSGCDTPFEVPFPHGKELDLELRSGDIEIRGSDEASIRVECDVGPSQTDRAKSVVITFDGRRRLRVKGGPNDNVRFRIAVPKRTDLVVRCTAGDLEVLGVEGNKDVSLRAGDLTVEVGNPDDYSIAEASVTAGDIQAQAFGVQKGGLFRSFRRQNDRGRYRLRARLWAGDIRFR